LSKNWSIGELMTKIRYNYRCNVCKSLIEIVQSGVSELVCCGKKMHRHDNQENIDARHQILIKELEGGISVEVGNAKAHPMTSRHYIKFIEVFTPSTIFKHELQLNHSGEILFPVSKHDISEVKAYCNIHGLVCEVCGA